jgi:hypothetical protein
VSGFFYGSNNRDAVVIILEASSGVIMGEGVSSDDRLLITELLGREPRGLAAVQVRNAKGEPSVIRVESLVDQKPFPTLFWLIDKELNYWLDGLEAAGNISVLQHQIDTSADLKSQLASDHASYVAARDNYMSAAIRKQLTELNYLAALQKKGIGGISDFTRIRCFHTYYAAHLVQSNVVGSMIDRHFFRGVNP